jgi:hypothetical protein
MTMQSLGLAAAIALACSTGVAAAQEAAATPQALGALLHQGVLQGGGKAPGGTANANASAALSSGWNLQHCWTSVWYSNGSTSYIFAFNIEGTSFYASSGISSGGGLAANTLLHVCNTGQLYGVYVTDTSTGQFTEIQSKW